MKRYFYKANPAVRRVLEKQLNLVQQQQNFFRGAMLALIRGSPTADKHTLYQKSMELTINQQAQLAHFDHLQQMFAQFSALHKASRRTLTIYEKSSYQQQGLVDPDKFPIWGTKSKYVKWMSGWPSVQEQLRKEVGWTLRLAESSLQHVDAGRGVYVDGRVPMGTMMGFVPGKLYQPVKNFQRAIKSEKHLNRQYLTFPSDKILEMTRIPMAPSQYELQGHFKNPYAVGQYLNHPPPRTSANVCLQQITLPFGFFPSYLLQFLPYQFHLRPSTLPRTLIGIFSLRDIEPDQQLFVNYLEFHSLDIEDIPEWLIEPAPQSPFLTKNQYEHTPEMFWRIMEDYAMKDNRAQWDKFKNTVRYQPDRYEFEKGGKKYREMTMVKFQK